MEIIKKTINIRDFTEKYGAREPYINDESGKTSYGKIPYDIVVDSNVYANIPVVEYNEKQVVRFGTFALYFNWLRKFIAESKYYYPTNPKGVFTWTEKDPSIEVFDESGTSKYEFFCNCYGVYSGLPEENSAYTCERTLICVNKSAETFTNMFYDINSACSFLEDFSVRVLLGDYEESEPFVDIPILIDAMSNELGSEEYVEPFSSDTHELTFTGFTSSGVTVKSQLKTLLRQKTTTDNDGNVLDFVEINGVNELRYSIGTPQNFTYNSEVGAYTFNEIISVEICYDNGNYYDMRDDSDVAWTISDVGETGRIVFHYTVGNLFLNSNDKVNGIEYKEEYNFKINKSQYNGKAYLSVDYSSNLKPEWGEPDTEYAVAYYDVENTAYVNEYGYPAEYFIRRDSLIGNTEIKFKTNDIEIDRGTSASYEAFNVLGEVNSVEDIEKYRNDWYRIKGKND